MDDAMVIADLKTTRRHAIFGALGLAMPVVAE
jgi:hypothetical protein